MKTSLILQALAAAALAGSAAAQGTFCPGCGPTPKRGPSLADAYKPAAAPRPAPTPTPPPSAGGFKPYEPFKGASVYSPPKANPEPDPCVTSVFSNACQKKRQGR